MLAILAALSPFSGSPAENSGGLGRQLLQGCLSEPTNNNVAKLASAIGATPYSYVRTRHELEQHENSTIVDDNTHPDEAQRTEITVRAFSGWDLPGRGAGSLEYSEGDRRMTRVKVATGQPIAAWRAARTRACRIVAPVANARAILELYLGMQHGDYGMLVSADRRWISMFTFDPDHYDVELQFDLDAPLPGLRADVTGQGRSRIVLRDGGPLFDGDPGPGVPTVAMDKTALLLGLNQPADMTFVNETSERVVQRL